MNQHDTDARLMMLEALGYVRFLAEADTDLLDSDRDAGGERQLLRVEVENDEPLVCLRVKGASGSGEYVVRVPPDVQTCQQAAAWLADSDNSEESHRPPV